MKQPHFSILLLLSFLTFSVSLFSQGQRKKVGVVLSGGGAKGVAHIKALKVIEEAGIPIDYIAGTSMGSIVGACMPSVTPPNNWIAWCENKIGHSC